jgi:hypothetical protein
MSDNIISEAKETSRQVMKNYYYEIKEVSFEGEIALKGTVIEETSEKFVAVDKAFKESQNSNHISRLPLSLRLGNHKYKIEKNIIEGIEPEIEISEEELLQKEIEKMLNILLGEIGEEKRQDVEFKYTGPEWTGVGKNLERYIVYGFKVRGKKYLKTFNNRNDLHLYTSNYPFWSSDYGVFLDQKYELYEVSKFGVKKEPHHPLHSDTLIKSVYDTKGEKLEPYPILGGGSGDSNYETSRESDAMWNK